MHATYNFLLNYDDITAPNLDADLVKASWMLEEGVRRMFMNTKEDGTDITSQNFEQILSRFQQGLEEMWENFTDQERETIRQRECEKAKYMAIADELQGQIEDKYMDDEGDENNWYQPEIAVFKNGMIAPMCELNDWRGRGWVYYQYLRHEQSERWERAFRFAVGCLAYDFNIPGTTRMRLDNSPDTEVDRQIDSLNSQELLQALEYYAPRYISKMLLEYVATIINTSRHDTGSQASDITIGDLIDVLYPKDPNNTDKIVDATKALSVINKESGFDSSMRDWSVNNALEIFQTWKDANCRPFTREIHNPYFNYRCYDLREWSNDRPDNFIEENSAIVMVDVHT